MVFPLRAHIQPNSPPTRRSGKKRLAKILTSRLFIIGVLILIQLFLLLFILVRLGTMKYWISVAFTVISFLMVLCILPREDNPSYKISWIILVMAVPLVGGIFYLMFGRKANSRRMAQQMESYTQSLLHIDHGDPLQDKVQSEQTLNLLRRDHPALARQADYIYNASGFELYQNTQAEYFPIGEAFYQRLLQELRGAKRFILLEYFIIQPGKMWDSILKILENRRKHGVQIRILYDDVGCVATLPRCTGTTCKKAFRSGSLTLSSLSKRRHQLPRPPKNLRHRRKCRLHRRHQPRRIYQCPGTLRPLERQRGYVARRGRSKA